MIRSAAKIAALTRHVMCIAAISLCGDARHAVAQTLDLLLIDRALQTQPIRLAQIDDASIAYRDATGSPRRMPVDDCFGLIRPDAHFPDAAVNATPLLILADDQLLPGAFAEKRAADSQTVSWLHSRFGLVQPPLDTLASLVFDPSQPLPQRGRMDRIALRNGDRIEGFVSAITSVLELASDPDEPARAISIPLDRVASIAFFTPRRSYDGCRIWIDDGTVLNVDHLNVTDDGYCRLNADILSDSARPTELPLADVLAILIRPQGVVPFASLAPEHLESSVPRYAVPEPIVLDQHALLDLPRIQFRGPLLARYTLPHGCRRFAADVVLPEASRAWGDLLLILSCDDAEVFRCRLNGERPHAEINIEIRGSQFSLELDEAGNGPIHDRVIFRRAAFLTGAPSDGDHTRRSTGPHQSPSNKTTPPNDTPPRAPSSAR